MRNTTQKIPNGVCLKSTFEYVFPAASRIAGPPGILISMCPLRLLPKIFFSMKKELVPELRAQRTLISPYTRYGTIHFKGTQWICLFGNNCLDRWCGYSLSVGWEAIHTGSSIAHPMDARFIINDGSTKAAIEVALRENQTLQMRPLQLFLFGCGSQTLPANVWDWIDMQYGK